jgi:hypothetical protein
MPGRGASILPRACHVEVLSLVSVVVLIVSTRAFRLVLGATFGNRAMFPAVAMNHRGNSGKVFWNTLTSLTLLMVWFFVRFRNFGRSRDAACCSCGLTNQLSYVIHKSGDRTIKVGIEGFLTMRKSRLCRERFGEPP